MATWFLAYSEGQTSTRKLERQCQRDLHYIYTSANLKPDHTSLSRFRKRHLERLPGYFVQIIQMAVERGVSDFRLISIDGSKFQAGCSSRKSRDAEALEAELKAIRKRIAEYFNRCELLDEEPSAPEDLAELREKIESLQQLERTLQERQQELEDRRAQLQSKDRKKHRINVVEPDARSMTLVNGKPGVPGYNAQLSVDTQSQLIVAADITDERTDQKQFSAQHQQAEENLGSEKDRKYVARCRISQFRPVNLHRR